MLVRRLGITGFPPTAAAALKGVAFWITDGADAEDASTGGGSYINLIGCDGSSWKVLASLGRAIYDDGTDVGIGTTAPALVNGSSTNILEIEGATNPALALHDTTNSQQWVMYANDDLILFDATGNANRLKLATTGAVTLSATGTLRINLGTCQIHEGSGSPESVVTAPVGSTYHRTDGGAGTSYYVKESGAGNTGWVGK